MNFQDNHPLATPRIQELASKVGKHPADLIGNHIDNAQAAGEIDSNEAAELQRFLTEMGTDPDSDDEDDANA